MKETHREMAARLWNAGGAQAVVILICFLAGLLVLLSLSPGSILKDLIAGIGAIGQVFLAFMVWQLTRQQFDFQKKLAARQERIDLLSERSKIVDTLVRMNNKFRNVLDDREADEASIIELRGEIEAYSNIVKGFFSRHVGDFISSYTYHVHLLVRAWSNLKALTTDIEILGFPDLEDRYRNAVFPVAEAKAAWIKSWADLRTEISAEMVLVE